jgi:hypothetical protein
MIASYYNRKRGLGSVATDQKIVNIGGALATPIIGVVAGSSIAAAVGTTAAVAVPVIGIAIAAAVMAIDYLIQNSGCGVTCVETSQWANQAAAALDANIAAYFNTPAPRTQSEQTVAVQAFDNVWQQLVTICGQPGTGNAGVRCITDRQQGACTWKALPPKWPGEPTTGACWNWFNAYRDPIANDTSVVADTVASAGGVVSSIASSLTSSPLLLGGALLLVGLMAGGKD